MAKKNYKAYRDLVVFLNLGWVIAITLTGFSLGGIYLDNKFGRSPLFLLLGLLLAFIFCAYFVYQAIKKTS